MLANVGHHPDKVGIAILEQTSEHDSVKVALDDLAFGFTDRAAISLDSWRLFIAGETF